MAAFFGNLRNVVIAGFVLAIVLVAASMSAACRRFDDQAFWLFSCAGCTSSAA